jgi:hypothetical protein
VGDGATEGDGPAVAAMIASYRVDRFLYLGDVYPVGTARDFEVNYRQLFGRFDPVGAPTIGNHEWPNLATGYVPYWTGARGSPPPLWYGFAVSGWQLISLNSNAPIANSPSSSAGWTRRSRGPALRELPDRVHASPPLQRRAPRRPLGAPADPL